CEPEPGVRLAADVSAGVAGSQSATDEPVDAAGEGEYADGARSRRSPCPDASIQAALRCHRDPARERPRHRGAWSDRYEGAGPSDRSSGASMIALPSNARVWLAAGTTDMRKGFDGLAGLVQTQLVEDPFSGHLFVFRGRAGDRVKILWWSGDGWCLFAKRLEGGRV